MMGAQQDQELMTRLRTALEDSTRPMVNSLKAALLSGFFYNCLRHLIRIKAFHLATEWVLQAGKVAKTLRVIKG